MQIKGFLAMVLVLAATATASAKKDEHDWLVGKVLDENRARYFAGMLNNSSSQTTENGSWNGNANSTSIGNSTNTQLNGSYSGTRSTSGSGTSIPVYRVYDNLVIEGKDTVYVTSERLRWRWSKGAHVAVHQDVEYYVDGKKLHVLDNDHKEHTIEILKEVRKVSPSVPAAATIPPDVPQQAAMQGPSVSAVQATVAIDSAPEGADIEIDGAFVGNTPSTVNVAPGNHQIAVRRKGFTDWSKSLNVTGGSVRVNADLDPTPPTQ